MTDVAPVTVALVSTRRVYDGLAAIYLPIAVGVFVVVAVAVLYAVLRYRRSPTAARWSEHNRLEGGYALLLVAVATTLIALTLHAEHRVDTVADRERPALVVDVIAAQWEWEFREPAYGIVARSGTVGHQPLVVPADRALRFRLSSQDVIHSLWIPQLEFKRDLIPGTTELVTLTFTHLGTFSGQCAEFCGLHHADMNLRVRVLAPHRFEMWARAHRGT